MIYNRSSMLVKLGRGFQNGYKYMSFLDVLAAAPLLFTKSASCPVICIVAPPRSGSTLSYQVITTLIENLHLTNIWNLLYSTPVMACSISNALCKSYNAKFMSDNGFVQGLCGESEGMRFWEYWSGQGLLEDPGSIDEKQLQKLYRAMSKISGGKVFVTGYIGHAFCMNSLRKAFPEIIFVHVTRDLLSNAYSIYQRSIKGWFSLKPLCCQGENYDSPHERVVDQLLGIHNSIIAASRPSDTILVRYEEICREPSGVIEKIMMFGQVKDIQMQGKPRNSKLYFKANKITKNLNNDARKINDIIKKKMLKKDGYISEILL